MRDGQRRLRVLAERWRCEETMPVKETMLVKKTTSVKDRIAVRTKARTAEKNL
jgi:hypothetical protein